MSHRFKAPRSLSRFERRIRLLAGRITSQEQLNRFLDDGRPALRRAAFDRVAPFLGFSNPQFFEPQAEPTLKGNESDERREQPAGTV